ncbi:MAG: hypothetical protein WAU11_16250 [Ignavibacteriaceae bacterium]
MKTVLSFIIVFLFTLQIFSQNLSFIETDPEDLDICSAKIGSVIHKLEERYIYGYNYNRSTDKGKTWKSDAIVSLINSVREEYLKKDKNTQTSLKTIPSNFPQCTYLDNAIMFVNSLTYEGEQNISFHEAIYSQDGINWQYIPPFNLRGEMYFTLFDDKHFFAEDMQANLYTAAIENNNNIITLNIKKCELPLSTVYTVEDGKLFLANGNSLYMSSDFGESVSEIFTDTEPINLERVYSKDDFIIITTGNKFIASNDKGKTFAACPYEGIIYYPLSYDNRIFYINLQINDLVELVFDNNTLKEKPLGSSLNNMPLFDITCTWFEEVNGKVIFCAGPIDPALYRDNCSNVTYYVLK